MRELIVNGKKYRPHYKFDGGEYFTPAFDDPSGAWLAIMESGELTILVNGKHRLYNAEWELVETGADKLASLKEQHEKQMEHYIKQYEEIKGDEPDNAYMAWYHLGMIQAFDTAIEVLKESVDLDI